MLLACECGETSANAPASAFAAVHDWLLEGGRIFATHFQYTWFKNGPADFQGVATWLGTSTASGSGNYTLDTSFPKGQVLHDWLGNIGAANGNTVAMNAVANSVSTVSAPTVRWIYDGSNDDVKSLSFLTPIGGIPASSGPTYCGKASFSDVHAGGSPSGDIPGSCTVGAKLTAQEQALEFLFFDLSACVSDDSRPPPPPPPPDRYILTAAR